MIQSVGEDIIFDGDDIFRQFWEKIKDIVYYKSYFKSSVGKPFLFIKRTKRTVGTYFQFKKGNVVLIPHLADKDDFHKAKDYENASNTFVSAIIDLVNSLKSFTGDYILSEWTDAYFLPREKGLFEKIHKDESRLRNISDSINKKKMQLENVKQYKLLLCGKGVALQKKVISVLNEIGLKAKEGPEGRDDIEIEYKGNVGVAEVKGTSKSAAEYHAAQLEKWVSEYYSNNGIQAKGFLIVNAFCETPLDERKEPSFPNQMLKYCTDREHCLITTAQLLNILLEIKRNPKKRDKIITKLFSTVGIYKGYNNYEDYLEIESSQILTVSTGLPLKGNGQEG